MEAEREGFEPPGPRERAGCFQGSCNQPDSATAPSMSVSRSVTERRLEKHFSDEVFGADDIEDVQPIVRVVARTLDDVTRRVRMDVPQIDLASRAAGVLALNARKPRAVVDDKVVGRRFGQRDRNIEAHFCERRDRYGTWRYRLCAVLSAPTPRYRPARTARLAAQSMQRLRGG